MLKKLQTQLAKNPFQHFSKFILLILSTVLLLNACSNIRFPGIYRIDIPQGNVVSQDLLDRLRPGMSPSQVKYILGAPLIQDIFNENRWDYHYSLKSGETGETKYSLVTVFFSQVAYSHHEISGEIEARSIRTIPREKPVRKKFLGIF